MTAATEQTFSTRYLPWTRVGTTIDASVDSREASRLGGLDFTVVMRPSGFVDETGWHRVGDRYAVVREDTGQFFDFVSNTYKIVQYVDAFTFIDGVEGVRFVAAGSLSGGRQGFIVAQLPQRDRLDPTPLGQPDPHDLYVVVRTSHDRSKAIEVALMPLRHRCMNQVPLPSFTRDAPQRWAVRHVGDDPVLKLAEARLTLQRAENYATVYEQTVRQLTSVRVTREDLRQIMRRVLPDRPQRDARITRIETIFTTSPTVGYPNTGWALVNAVGEQLEWGRNEGHRTAQSRLTAALQGDVLRYVGRTAQLVLSRS